MSQSPSEEGRVAVGVVVGCHGLRGELKVRPLTDDPDRFGELDRVLLRGEAAPREIEGYRVHKGHVLLRLAGVPDRDAAEALRGAELTIARDQRRELPEGRFYHDDLLGLEVRDPGGARLGQVRAFDEVSTPSGLLRVALDAGGVVEVPFVEAWVEAVQIEDGVVVVSARWRQLRDPATP